MTTLIRRALKVRLYPTREQSQFLRMNIGSCRALYNMMLYERKEAYEKFKEITQKENSRELFTTKFKTEVDYKVTHPWLKEAESTSLQQARIHLEVAYTNFFNGLKNKRQNRVGFPKFKKKKNGGSYTSPQNAQNIKVDFDKKLLKLPKIKSRVKFSDPRKLFPSDKIKSVTVSLTPTGKFYASVLYEREIEIPHIEFNKNSKTKGLDMSLQSFFVDDSGGVPAYERLYRKFEERMIKRQRNMSHKKKGSKNRFKAQLKVNRIHEKISNKRQDFTHKLSTSLVRENDVIVVESLSLKGMSQCLNLGKSVMDLGYSEFVRQLQYKTFESGKLLVKADRWFASSKTCSMCGFIKSDLELSDRQWVCENCGVDHNRDQNAAYNLKRVGDQELRKILKTVGSERSELKVCGDPDVGQVDEAENSTCEGRKSMVDSQ